MVENHNGNKSSRPPRALPIEVRIDVKSSNVSLTSKISTLGLFCISLAIVTPDKRLAPNNIESVSVLIDCKNNIKYFPVVKPLGHVRVLHVKCNLR